MGGGVKEGEECEREVGVARGMGHWPPQPPDEMLKQKHGSV